MLYIFINLISSMLSAEIVDFLKPALNKSEINQMPEIDFIYMINLDERPEKFSQSVDQLTPFNIFPYRFSAVNGWKLPLENLKSLGITYDSTMPTSFMGTRYRLEEYGNPTHEMMIVGENYFCHGLAKGTIGIVLSHLSVLQDAYDSGYETIWVMEDDIDVVQDPNILPSLIKELDDLVGKKSWDILFTDPDSKHKNGNYVVCTDYHPRPNITLSNPKRFDLNEKISLNFKKTGARYGAYSMIIRRSGIKKLLDFILKYRVFLPYDLEYIFPNINLYSLNFDVVSTLPGALTDNRTPNYKNENPVYLEE